MASIELSKPELLGVLPQQEYDRFSRNPQNRSIPKALLKLFSDIPLDASGDVFGQIYEYFLGNFAMSEGQGGGEFFTPRSVVRLTYERALFKQKCDNVFELVVDYASRGRKWAA